MITINLKVLYPHIYSTDKYLSIDDDTFAQQIMHIFAEDKKRQRANMERARRNYACHIYDEGVTELELLSPIRSLHDIYEEMEINRALHSAIEELPDVQRRRIYALFFLGYSKSKIAYMEGVDKSSVRQSIERALRNIRKKLECYL